MLGTDTGQVSEILSRPNETKEVKPLGSAHAPYPKPHFPSWKLRAQELHMDFHVWLNGGYKKDNWETPYFVRRQGAHDLKDFSN